MKRSQAETPPQYFHQDHISISGPDLITLLRDILEKGSTVRFQVRGSSMFPFIRNGDVICIAPMGGKPPAIGEVVAFVHHPGSRLMVHRIIRKTREGVVIKGDNNRACDGGIVRSEHILGRLTRLERAGKTIRSGSGIGGIITAWLSRTGGLRLIKRLIRPLYRLLFRKGT